MGSVVRVCLRSVPVSQRAVARHLRQWLLDHQRPWMFVPCGPALVPSPSGGQGLDPQVAVSAHGIVDAEGCPAVPLLVQPVQVVQTVDIHVGHATGGHIASLVGLLHGGQWVL